MIFRFQITDYFKNCRFWQSEICNLISENYNLKSKNHNLKTVIQNPKSEILCQMKDHLPKKVKPIFRIPMNPHKSKIFRESNSSSFQQCIICENSWGLSSDSHWISQICKWTAKINKPWWYYNFGIIIKTLLGIVSHTYRHLSADIIILWLTFNSMWFTSRFYFFALT